MEVLKALLRESMTTPGISGYEGNMVRWMKSHLSGCTDRLEVDRAGNVIGVINGTDPSAYRTMLFAHMDQIGMVVANILDDGYLCVTKNGSVPDKVLPGCELVIRTLSNEYIPGCVAVKSYHAMRDADKASIEPITELLVDIGAKGKKDVHDAGIRIGCAVQYKPNFVQLLGNRIAGTAIDNRASCTAIVRCAQYFFENRPNTTLYVVGTVQEEHNLRGGLIAARAINPDIAICLDVTLASDAPGMGMAGDNPIGMGPTLNMYSFHGRGTLNGTIAHEGLACLAQQTADECGIHLSRFAMRGLLTDASYVQLEGCGGVATIDLSFPVRNAHSPMEVCDVEDLYGLYRLTCGMISRIDAGFNCSRF